MHVTGLDITYGVVWYQIGRGEGKLHIRNHKEGNGKPPRFIFPRHDMDVAILAILSKDNSVNQTNGNAAECRTQE